MAIYKSFAELKGNQLKYKDRIIFEHDGYRIEGVVYNITLGAENYEDIETKIFSLLGLDAYEFCEQHYNHLPEDWEWFKTECPEYWPPHCFQDYESITKVVLELFAKIEKFEELAETSTTLFID